MEYLLDNYDLDSDSDTNKANTTVSTTANTNTNAATDLGVDEAVVVKKRKIAAKLDETRLLGSNGIPSLKAKIAPKIKFRGKGHERRDLTKLLSTYQLWGHGLFPKANFMDFIQLCKKAGTTPAMRVYRRQWVDEEKRKSTSDALDDMYRKDQKDKVDDGDDDVDDVDDADDLTMPKSRPSNNSIFVSDDDIPADIAPSRQVVDELDAIWDSVNGKANTAPSKSSELPNDSDDDLNEIRGPVHANPGQSKDSSSAPKPTTTIDLADSDDDIWTSVHDNQASKENPNSSSVPSKSAIDLTDSDDDEIWNSVHGNQTQPKAASSKSAIDLIDSDDDEIWNSVHGNQSQSTKRIPPKSTTIHSDSDFDISDSEILAIANIKPTQSSKAQDELDKEAEYALMADMGL